MKPNQPIYITDFTGQAENPNTGAGVYVGIDLYTTKTVARLSRKMNKKSGSIVTHLPIYDTEDNQGILYVQDEMGNVYKSIDQGVTWTSLFTSVQGGFGMIVWEDYLFMCTPDDINIYGPLSGSPNLVLGWWTLATGSGGAGQTALVNKADVNHFPFINPSVNFLYFANDNYIASIQKLSTPFDPANSSTFLANDKSFTLASFYNAKVIGYLPPNNIAIGCQNRLGSQSDVVIWDGVQNTTAVNVVTLPGASNPVIQMSTRNGVLYCVTDVEHGVYVVNGSSAQLIDRLALRMSNRTSGGTQYTTRVQSNIYPSAIDFLGPELLTAGSNFPSPVSQITGTGLYPYGVWSVNIETNAYGQTVDTGSTGVIGLRFPLSYGQINAQYTSDYAIGFVRVLSNNSVMVGWQNGSTYGIDLLDAQNYITDPTTVFVESSLYLAGTRLQPRTFNTFEFNLIAPLNAGEQIQFYWRDTQAMDYQLFDTVFDATRLNGELSGAIQILPFQNVKYIQIAARLNAGSITNLTPQLRDAILK